MPLMTLKMAVFAPIPIAIVSSVTAVNSGARVNLRDISLICLMSDPTPSIRVGARAVRNFLTSTTRQEYNYYA